MDLPVSAGSWAKYSFILALGPGTRRAATSLFVLLDESFVWQLRFTAVTFMYDENTNVL